VAKDRARPFLRKHRKYWIPVTGGMILIGAINVALGFCTYDPPSEPPRPIKLNIPHHPRPDPQAGLGSGSAAGSAGSARSAGSASPTR